MEKYAVKKGAKKRQIYKIYKKQDKENSLL